MAAQTLPSMSFSISTVSKRGIKEQNSTEPHSPDFEVKQSGVQVPSLPLTSCYVPLGALIFSSVKWGYYSLPHGILVRIKFKEECKVLWLSMW